MLRGAWVLVVGVFACTPASTPTEEASRAPEPARAERPAYAEFLPDWRTVEVAWAEAPVWLVTQYVPGNSCESMAGGLVMRVLDRFVIGQVLRGEVDAKEVTLAGEELRGAAYPRAFAEGRRYLLFVRPGALGRRVLAASQGSGLLEDRLGLDEVVAVVDLDARRDEVAAEAVVASKAGEHKGFRFDTETWMALRAAQELDAAQLRGLVGFLAVEVLVGLGPLADVRAWLGPPDQQELFPSGARRDVYYLGRGVIEAKRDGEPYALLSLHYDPYLRLDRVRLEYIEMKVTPGVYVADELGPEYLAKRGLPALNVRWEPP